MFCTKCGAGQADDTSRFCSKCGAAIPSKIYQPNVPSDSSTGQVTGDISTQPRLRTSWLLAGTALIALLLYAEFSSDTQKTDSPAPIASNISQRREPPQANVTLHAYDLLQNPYSYRNQIVVLNLLERPVLYNGSVIQYANIGGTDPRVATQLGLMALRLNRMISAETALYDVMGVSADYSSDAEMLGQLAVILPEGRKTLELDRYWEVEPLGVLQGTNGFGAPIQVPQVRFWRYSDERHPASHELSGDGLRAVNLVKARIKSTQYLMSLEPDFNWTRWDAVNNKDECDGCWYVTYGVKVKAKSTSDYDYYENGAWWVNIKAQTVSPVNSGDPSGFTTRLFETFQ